MTIGVLPGTGTGIQNLTTSTGVANLQTQISNYVWASSVLSQLGPTYVTPNNVNNMVAWMASEEPPLNWYHNNNPLNINAGGSGSDTFPSLSAAASETAKWIGTYSNYTGIKNALANNAPYPQFKAAVVASPWAAGHYNNGSSFAGVGQPTVSVSGQTLLAGNAQASTTGASVSGTPGTCSSRGNGIGAFGVNIGTGCQLKALSGGLLVGVGGIALMTGTILIVAYGMSQTKLGKQAVSAVGGSVGVVGKTAKAVTRASPKAISQRRSDERLYQQSVREAPERKARNARYRAAQADARKYSEPDTTVNGQYEPF